MGGIWFKIRLTIYTVTLLTVSLWAVVIAFIATICGKRLNTNYFVARTFWYTAGPIMGWDFDVEGEEHLWRGIEDGGRSAVMVGNHQSFVDIIYLGRIFPKAAAIMAKKSIRLIPGLGWFMLMSGTVFIDRSNNRSAVASMTQAGEDMKRKKISLWIFPEGTRHSSAEPELLSFKKGAFYLAVQSGVPVIPVVCQNYHHLFDGKTRFKSGKLTIKVLPPIPTTGLTAADVPKLMDQTREAMLTTLRELHHLSIPNKPAPHSKSKAPRRPPIEQTPSQEALLPQARVSGSAGYGTTTQQLSSTNEEESVVEETLDHDEDTASEIAPQTVETLDNPSGRNRDHERSSKASKSRDKRKSQLSIAMISDFFLPVVGGVEGHIYSLSVELIKRGHRVIVITHHHGDRKGIRHLAPGLKVYHLPIIPIALQATLPNFLLFLPWFRHIMLRERIDLVHGHGTLSSLAHEAMYHSHLLVIRSVMSDHSLFGFGDAVGVLTNKLLAGALRNVDGVICVSNTGRENTVLRAQLDPHLVSVIPNALIAEQFEPDPSAANPQSDIITIVTVSRLVYRKGIDLLVASAPTICDLFPEVRFVVGGDGPKMVDLEQMREKYRLQDRITLLGSVRPSEVQSSIKANTGLIGQVLNRGQIYLNTSLTEAFGISTIEAASAGLFVVSTKVGGLPEILPGDMIEFARADEDDVIRALSNAIRVIKSGQHDPLQAHERVKDMYAWSDVARRTELVYERAMASPRKDTFERLTRLLSLGPVFGPILCCIMAVQHWFFWFLEWYDPRDEIEYVDDIWSSGQFRKEVHRERQRIRA